MNFTTPDGRSYSVDSFDAVHQTDAKPFVYDQAYVDRYCAPEYAEQAVALSTLRLGWMMGVFTRTLHDQPKSLLDIGYGTGAFMREAVKIIPVVHGKEEAPVPVPAGCARVTSIEQHYDVITFWDSLEHHADLSFVRDLPARLVAVSVPWCHSWARVFFEPWKHRKPDEHLHHFSAEALHSFMYSMGWIMVTMGHHEDIIRIPTDGLENILTAAFIRR